MAGDQAQFYQLLNTILSIDNEIRTQAEVSNFFIVLYKIDFSVKLSIDV